MPRDYTDVPVITADTPGAIYVPSYTTGRGSEIAGYYRMPTQVEQAATYNKQYLDSVSPDVTSKMQAAGLQPYYEQIYADLNRRGGGEGYTDGNILGYVRAGPDNTLIRYDLNGNYKETVSKGGGGILGGISDFISHVGDVVSNDPIAKTVATIGVAVATGGASAALSASLLEAGVVSSAIVADAAAAAIVNAGVQVAQGVPLEKAVENSAINFAAGQYITPAISAEVRSVITSPTAANMAISAGTSIATGVLRGQSEDQITKAAIGAATGSLAVSAGKTVGSEVLKNIEDPDVARIAAATANAATKSAILGKDISKSALDAGATELAHTDLGLGDTMSNLTSGLPSIDMTGVKEAIKPVSDALTSVAQPISDAVTKVTQPLEQPIKDIAQAGSDAVTSVTQPISDAATKVLQPVEGAIKDVVGNLPSVDIPKVDIPKVKIPSVNGSLPTQTATTTPTTGALPATTTTDSASSNWLDSTPQMLKAASTTSAQSKNPNKLAELHQLYNSLTPEMQEVFADQGVQSPTQEEQTMTFATGGSAQSIMDTLTPKFAAGPKVLDAAPVTAPLSRMGALKFLRSPAQPRPQPESMAQGGLPTKYAEAAPEGHKPEFITGVTGYYAQGGGTGQSDDIPAMLHDGDYVIDADAVAAFGDGSSKAGAEVLSKFQSQIPFKDDGASKGKPVAAKIADGEYVFPSAFVTAVGGGDNKRGAKILDTMRESLRQHKRAAPTSKIPPKAKSPLDYLKSVKG